MTLQPIDYYDSEKLGLPGTRSILQREYKAIEIIRRQLPADDHASILDVGCGDGSFLQQLDTSLKRPYEYHGIDYSEYQVRNSRSIAIISDREPELRTSGTATVISSRKLPARGPEVDSLKGRSDAGKSVSASREGSGSGRAGRLSLSAVPSAEVVIPAMAVQTSGAKRVRVAYHLDPNPTPPVGRGFRSIHPILMGLRSQMSVARTPSPPAPLPQGERREEC